MASSLNKNNTFTPFILPVLLATTTLLAFTIPNASADLALINSICKQTREKDLCFQILKPHETADLPTLEKITLGVAKPNCQQTLSIIKSLAGKDPKTKQIYSTCQMIYGEAMSNIGESEKALNSKDYYSLGVKVSAVYADATNCGKTFEEVKATMPSQLKQACDKFMNVVDVALSISAKLN